MHRGVELGLGLTLAQDWQIDASLSYAKHTYETWTVSGTADYSGKEMETAPRVIANTRFSYSPGYMNGGRFQLEWFRLGSYWLDAANTGKYGGHNLINLRANYPFGKGMELFGSISNLFDKHYAETADGTDLYFWPATLGYSGVTGEVVSRARGERMAWNRAVGWLVLALQGGVFYGLRNARLSRRPIRSR